MSEKAIIDLENTIRKRYLIYETSINDLVGSFSTLINFLKNENKMLRERVVELEKKVNKDDETKEKVNKK